MDDKSARLIAHFNAFDTDCESRGFLCTDTEADIWQPSPLAHIDHVVKEFLKRGVLSKSAPFLDAGSGDGRVVALTSLHGIPSYGIEYDQEFAALSLRKLRMLKEMGILNGTPATIVQGDFSKDETCQKLGVDFTKFLLIFNYRSNVQQIASKVKSQSPKGTRFVLYEFLRLPSPYYGLDLEEVLELDGLADRRVYHEPMFAHVYRKT